MCLTPVQTFTCYFFKFYLFPYFWLCWVFVAVGFSLVVVSGGCSLVAAHRLLFAVAFLVVEYGLRYAGFSSCGTWAQ